MTLQQLHYVITISETGSFNRASERLYVAQPSLTGAVKELEKELGITIFHRSGKGVTLTADGMEFLPYARTVIHQYENLLEKFGKGANIKKKFGISSQHYTFAVGAFVELVKTYDTALYDFAMRETCTRDVIEDVATQKSELGILYLSDFNRKILCKLFAANNLEFHPLVSTDACVYLADTHPLAKKSSIRFAELQEYPCITYEQSDETSFYFSEEILSTNEYARTVHVRDRATVLNLMRGLNGYILCPSIISDELNGSGCVAVRFEPDEINTNSTIEIGYIMKKNAVMTKLASLFVERAKSYLENCRKSF